MGKSKKPKDTGQIIKGQCDGLLADLEKQVKLFNLILQEVSRLFRREYVHK